MHSLSSQSHLEPMASAAVQIVRRMSIGIGGSLSMPLILKELVEVSGVVLWRPRHG